MALDQENVSDQGAKVEAMVETICVVDVRNNEPQPLNVDPIASSMLSLRLSESFQPKPMGDDFNPSPTKKKGEKSKTNKSQETPKADMVFLTTFPASDKSISIQETKESVKTSNEMSEAERKKARLKLREQRALALKEAQWQGRSGGLDVGKFGVEGFRDLVKIKKRKAQRGELAPIADILKEANTMLSQDSSADNLSPLRVTSAQDKDDVEELLLSADESLSESEKAVKFAIVKARGKKLRKRRKSRVEARLIQSPFADPIESAKSMI